jgi:hypothetical protein
VTSHSSAVDTADLYHVPLEDFVARRTALVRELRATDPDAALAIGKVRKPSVGVWAIDQLAVENTTLITELLAAGADARDAHQNAAAGTESREDLLAATGRLRDGVEAAARAARDVLESAGHAASDETSRRIRATLQAAATGRAAERRALWTGTLDRDLDAAGFGAVDNPGNDDAELAAILAPLRRRTSSEGRAPRQDRSSATIDLVARRQAERDVARQDEGAARARVVADEKRRQADRLATEARVAADEASEAEQDADAAEEAARVAHLALDS